MKKYQYLLDALSGLVWVGQLGLDLLMPVLLCVALCWWLNTRVGVGGWVYVPGFALGLGGGFATARRFYLSSLKKAEEKKQNQAFNRHE